MLSLCFIIGSILAYYHIFMAIKNSSQWCDTETVFLFLFLIVLSIAISALCVDLENLKQTFLQSKLDKLSDAFNDVSEKIIQKSVKEEKKGTNVLNTTTFNEISQVADRYRKLETLEKCFKAYATAVADI